MAKRKTMTLSRSKGRSPFSRRRGPSPALVKAKKQAAAYRTRLAAARRNAKAGGAVPLWDIGSIVLGGGARGMLNALVDKYFPQLPAWIDPGVMGGILVIGASSFGLIKGKTAHYLALAAAGMVAAGASDLVEDFADRYIMDMLPGGAASAPEVMEVA